MKNLSTALFLTIVFISCNDNNDPAPAQESQEQEYHESGQELNDVSFVLFGEAEAITLPEAMKDIDDEHAQYVNTALSNINFSAHKSFFAVPEGATKIVGTANSRSNASTLTYEWKWQDGSIFYQITDETDRYLFDIFLKEGKQYTRLYEGEQAKDLKSGQLVIMNPSNGEIAFEYNYTVDEARLGLSYAVPSQNFSREIVLQSDKSGSIKSYIGDRLTAEYNWDGAGNGNWKKYDDQGNISQGSWRVAG